MAILTVQDITRAGITPSFTAGSAGGDSFANDGRTLFEVKNSGTEKVVTIATQKTVDGKAVADDAITIPATTGDKMIGPFPPSIYNDSNGRVQVTYADATGLTVAAFRLA